MDDEKERVLREAVMAQFKVFSWYCLDWLKSTKEISFRAVVCITA
jgi:hypothetical protein